MQTAGVRFAVWFGGATQLYVMKPKSVLWDRAGSFGRRGGSQASCLTYPPLRAPSATGLTPPTVGLAINRRCGLAAFCHGQLPGSPLLTPVKQSIRIGLIQSNGATTRLVLHAPSVQQVSMQWPTGARRRHGEIDYGC